ncbi:MAG: SDR family NAD(P)-dependent oxidoreductase [Puniceicoccaceae bacterium]|nr:MAG: SDR family NAD(P)-dependent oxidoreductase [Puniceicoccaceae bacterium]
MPASDLSYAGRTALVTGASRGIGLAIARSLAPLGFRLLLTARHSSGLAAAAEALRKDFPDTNIETLPGDIASEEHCRKLVDAADTATHPLYLLVNNAGVSGGGPVQELETAELDRVLEVNLHGPFWCAREAWRRLRDHQIHPRSGLRGALLHVSSLAGVDAWAGTAAYSMSKFGLNALSRSLADEGKTLRIRSCAICPAMVATDMSGVRGEAWLQPEDIALTVDYLLRLSPAAWPAEIILPRRDA